MYLDAHAGGNRRTSVIQYVTVHGGILTVEGCLGDDGQESESGELWLGTGAHSYQQRNKFNMMSCLLKTKGQLHDTLTRQSVVSERKKMNHEPDVELADCGEC